MSSTGGLSLFGVTGLGEVRPGDDLAALLVDALAADGEQLRPGDVLVVSSKVVSKAEGRVVAADTRETQITAETVRLVAARRTPNGLSRIVEGAAGPVMAAAGVDASNVAPGTVLLLPKDPDASARELRSALLARVGVPVGVIVSDTAGRAWRDGQVDFALGAAGVRVTDDLRGAVDTHGQSLEVTVRALVDELAAAADLVKGKLSGVPAAVIRGLTALTTSEDGPGAAILLRPARTDWFRHGHVEAVTASLGGDPGANPPTVPAGSVEDRFGRVLSLALLTPNPWVSGWGHDYLFGRSRGSVGTATLIDDDGNPRTAFGSEDWAALGALAQRIAAAAWAEDLVVEIDLIEGPPSLLRIEASDR